ncbi:cytochrome c oxidase assembly protein COX16-domain-containing protein [Blastocladiella britannica]|nr:cytochrome c oxidase assembly protein COX16-domain-containing protein [Blastocladiella britannica]
MSDSLPRPPRASFIGGKSMAAAVKRRPFLFFGLPMVGILVGGSFALSHLTQTKVEYNSTKVIKMSQEDKLELEGKKRRSFDLREEYFRLHSGTSPDKLALDDWDMVPIAKMPDTFIPPSPGEMEAILVAASTAPSAEDKPKPIVRW